MISTFVSAMTVPSKFYEFTNAAAPPANTAIKAFTTTTNTLSPQNIPTKDAQNTISC